MTAIVLGFTGMLALVAALIGARWWWGRREE
jgi:hypothetical protein